MLVIVSLFLGNTVGFAGTFDDAKAIQMIDVDAATSFLCVNAEAKESSNVMRAFTRQRNVNGFLGTHLAIQVNGDNGMQGMTSSASRLRPKNNSVDARLNVEKPRKFERAGPRLGINILYGDLAKGLTQQDYLPYMMLFGWQFEQVLTTGSGNTPALVF